MALGEEGPKWVTRSVRGRAWLHLLNLTTKRGPTQVRQEGVPLTWG